MFDPDSGKDLAVELRGYSMPDFSDWKKKASFDAALTKLLEDLRTDDYGQ